MSEYVSSKELIEFFDKLNATSINYILLRNLNQEIPFGLKTGKDIDILIPHKSTEMVDFLLNNNFKSVPHPYKDEAFNYGVTPYKMFKNKDGIIIDLVYEMTCRSANKGEWIPVHLSLQSRAFENKIFLDDGVKAWRLDRELELLMLVVRSVFDKKCFKPDYITAIKKLMQEVNIDNLKNEFELVFFKFTPHLVKKLKDNDFENIVELYIQFKDY